MRLDDVQCCALVHAFIRHPDLIAAWAEDMDLERLRVFANVLVHTKGMSVPEAVLEVYESFALEEIHFLESGKPAVFNCQSQLNRRLFTKHTRLDHIRALEEFITKIVRTSLKRGTA